MKIKNPRTGKYYYEIFPPTPENLKIKTKFMREVQTGWQESGIEFRINALKDWEKAIEEHKDELIDALSMDTGRKLETVLEVESIPSTILKWSTIARDLFSENVKITDSKPFLQIEQTLQPFPLVGVISTCNFPLQHSLIDTIPALLAGCAVIVKPSEITPRFIEVIQKTIDQIPNLLGILHFVEGGKEIGEELCKLTDLICFTGSNSTAKIVYKAAADNFIPVFLELSGKDAVIVTETADLESASSAILWGSVINAGQSCAAIERIYVHRNIYHQFLSRLVGKANLLQLAYPNMDSGQIGPILSERQVTIIDHQLDDAFKKGAILKCGSRKCQDLGGGFYCRPTILTNVNHEMKIMNEETLGPILPVMVYSTVDEAISYANRTDYSLGGAVFAGNKNEAMEIARKLKCESVFINDVPLTLTMEKDKNYAFKMFGISGARNEPNVIEKFLTEKTYFINCEDEKDPR